MGEKRTWSNGRRDAYVAEAIALGRIWAQHKADELRRHLPVAEWPDFWDDEEGGALPAALGEAERAKLHRAASRAAHERWLELLADQREAESVVEESTELHVAPDTAR